MFSIGSSYVDCKLDNTGKSLDGVTVIHDLFAAMAGHMIRFCSIFSRAKIEGVLSGNNSPICLTISAYLYSDQNGYEVRYDLF